MKFDWNDCQSLLFVYFGAFRYPQAHQNRPWECVCGTFSLFSLLAFPTFFHLTCKDFDYIYVSAGVRGLQLKISAENLVEYVGAEIADLVANNADC